MSTLSKLKRIQMNISQSKLAMMSGVDQYRVSLIERNLVRPRPEESLALSKALSITESELQKTAGISVEVANEKYLSE